MHVKFQDLAAFTDLDVEEAIARDSDDELPLVPLIIAIASSLHFSFFGRIAFPLISAKINTIYPFLTIKEDIMPTKATARKTTSSSPERSATKKPPAGRNKTGEQTVEFTYYAPEAKSVFLAGRFNDWDTSSLPMKKRKDGTWKTTVKLASGSYEYKFFVDGSWAQAQQDRETVENSFGTRNNVIGVE